MKRFWMSILLVLAAATFCLAAGLTVEAPADCQQCGMNRTTFSHSRMVVTYKDGSSTGVCSINCAATDMQQQPGKAVKSFRVGDYNSKKLIDARTATWVIGGKQQGVMTQHAKWAFADRKAAAAFVKENGGTIATFKEALAAAEKELKEAGHSGHKM